MDSKFYKNCTVPQCRSTTIKTPEKLFVHIPRKDGIRKKWLQIIGRKKADFSVNTKLYICEDHFDLPNDMENYTEYYLMGSVSQVRMKAGCLPRKYECPKTKISAGKSILPSEIKRQRLEITVHCERDMEQAATSSSHSKDEFELDPTLGEPQTTLCKLTTTNKSIQVSIHKPLSNKSTQTETKFTYMEVPPLKGTAINSKSLPELQICKELIPSMSGDINTCERLSFSVKEEQSDSDKSVLTTHSDSTSSFMSSQHMASSGNSSLNEILIKQEANEIVVKQEVDAIFIKQEKELDS